MSNAAKYTVQSANFDFHSTEPAASYTEALAVAKQRGFEALIKSGGVLVAAWSPLYGTTVYNRSLAD